MFPDSEIAKSYNQGETKWKYVIQFGTSNNWYWMILKRKPFSLLFDETTAQQVKKQFDIYLQYWSSENQTSDIYAGSYFIGHCNSDQLFHHFHHFLKELELCPSSVCWLTLKFVLVWIVEQWEILRVYFLEFLPKQKILNGKLKQLMVTSISKKFSYYVMLCILYLKLMQKIVYNKN